MASFPNVRRFAEPSAQAEGIAMTSFVRVLVDQCAAISNAAFGPVVATIELATLQRNAVPAYAPTSSTRGRTPLVEARRLTHRSAR